MKKKSECESEHAQMMDLQQVTEDVGIASNYLSYCLAKMPIKQKRNYLYRQYSTQCEPEFYNMNQSNLTFYFKPDCSACFKSE